MNKAQNTLEYLIFLSVVIGALFLGLTAIVKPAINYVLEKTQNSLGNSIDAVR